MSYPEPEPSDPYGEDYYAEDGSPLGPWYPKDEEYEEEEEVWGGLS